MNDTISRQKAIDALWKALFMYEDETEKQFIESEDLDVGDWILHQIFVQNMNDIDRKAILSLPSVEPERKKGRWIPVDSFSAFGGDEVTWMAHGNPVAFYYCSECKEHAYAGEDGTSILSDFCPHCGADMRGENNE